MTVPKLLLSEQKDEIDAVVGRLLDNLLTILPSKLGLATYAARRQIGDMRGQSVDLLFVGDFAADLLACFIAVREVGATLSGFDIVRNALLDETPVNFIPQLIVQSALLYCLSAQSRIVLSTTFISRDDVEIMMKRMAAAFDSAKEMAADQMDSACYSGLIQLAANLTVHLATTALLLPRMVTFTISLNYPALKLSHYLYHDASRSEELIAENHTVHPAFMQRNIRGLSQ